MNSTRSQLSLKPLLIVMTIFALLAIFIKSQFKTIEVVPASAAANVFSAERAFNQLQYLTKEQVPHSVDSAANRLVEQRLVELLQAMGYQEEIQDTFVCRDDTRGRGHCARVRNIIIKIAGTKPGKAILLSAHYDSAVSGPGASDAGAAVATLLETARLLTLSEPPLNSIILLFNEGEEFGLLGAQAFMEKHPLAQDIQVAINIEARGTSGQSVMFETGDNSGWLVNHYAETTPAPLSSSLFYEVYKFLPNDTDLTIYKQHGLQGLNFAHGEALPHYHTPMDNLANLDKGSLQHHGDNVWGVLNSIKDINLAQVKQGNLVYTDIMGLFVLQWQESASIVISLLVTFLFILTIYSFQQSQRISFKQLFIGIITVLVVFIVAVASAYIIQLLTRTISANPTPWYSNELSMRFALWLGALLSVIVVGKRLIKHATVIEICLSLLCVWSCLSLLTSLLMPGVSFLFIIPAVTGLIGITAITGLDRFTLTMQKKAQLQLIILLIMASISAISFIAVAYVLEVLITYKMAVAISVFISFAVCLLLPFLAIEKASNESFKNTSYVITMAMLACIGWTSWQTVFTDWMPQHLNVNYVQNGNNEGFVLVGHENNKVPAKLINALPAQAQLSTVFPWSKLSYYFASSQANLLKPAQLKLLAAVANDSGKQVTVSIVSPGDNFHELRVFIPTELSLSSIDIGDEVISYDDEPNIRNGFYEFRCRGLHCGQVQLTLNFDKSIQGKLLIASVYPGLPTQYMPLTEARGSAAVPYRSGDQSIVFSEFEL